MERLTTNIVPPDGPLSALACFIAEAPGEEENYRLRPLVGAAGVLFDRCLRVAGGSRALVLARNVFSQRPPNNDVGYFYQDKGKTLLTAEGQEHVEELRQWLEHLLQLRNQGHQGPNVIAAMGDIPMRVLTGQKGISKWRGSILPCTLVPGFKVYVLHHPSYVNRLMNEPEERLQGQKKKEKVNALPTFIRDLERVLIQAETPDYTPPPERFTIIKTLDEAISRLEHVTVPGKMVAVDIETLHHNSGPVVWCIGFADNAEEGFCIPILQNLKFAWTAKEETIIWRKISELFLHPQVKKIFHNSGFDLSILGRNYGLRVANGTLEDTMYAHQMNYPYMKKSLAYCVSIYTWRQYYKDTGKVHSPVGANDYQEFIYNCRDVCSTREILPIIKQDSNKLGTNHNYQLSMSVFPSMLYEMIKGVRIDIPKKAQLTLELPLKAREAEDRINSLILLHEYNTGVNLFGDGGINLRSSQQVQKLLYVELGCDTYYNHKTGKLTTDKDAMNLLLKKYSDPTSIKHQVLRNLSEFRKYSKLADTYAKFEVNTDGRVRTSYGWVTTFRLNSSESHFGGGGNLQNIPVRTEEGKAIRTLFIPDPGMEFGASDLEQAEAREVAWLAGDRKAIDDFLAGIDCHWENAKQIFGFDPKTPYHKEELISDIYTGQEHTMYFYRRLAKTIVHARNYRMGPMMLQLILIREEVFLPLNVCKKLLSSSRANSPLITRWQEKTIEEVRLTRRLVTALGDVREFRGRFDDSLARSAIAFRPQSVVGRLLQIASQNIHKDLNHMCDILLNVHDEVLWQNPPEVRSQLVPLVKERMEIPHMVNGRELTIPCSFKFGPNWGEAKEMKMNELLAHNEERTASLREA